MTMKRPGRWSALTLAVLGLALMLPAPALRADGVMYFTGGGYSLDPQGAIQAATWDAENSASAMGLFTCTLFGEPQVFSRKHPHWGIQYTAEVTLGCTP